MATPAIRIENLGKRYLVTHEQMRGGYKTLRESLMDVATAPVRRLRGERRRTQEAFWALKDVSFEVQPGEVVGIIGRNGAGKSTLLKVLSRITKPTTGRIAIEGRVGSLLEVGTGFHPELTGRENIFLNGSILGMTRREIASKFDAIVHFSGVEQFLDTPVKRYSSGMYVRLAFSVAAHLEPEILVIDEVLAVGDAEFQRRCLGKMEEVASHGRTVLFVSHNMSAVQSLCTRGVYLQSGHVVLDGNVNEAVDYYLQTVEDSANQSVRDRTDRRGSGQVRFTDVIVRMADDSPQGSLMTGRPASFDFLLNRFYPGTHCRFTIYDHRGQAVTNFDTQLPGDDDESFHAATIGFRCYIDSLPLRPGHYRINAAAYYHSQLADHLEGAAVFDVADGTFNGRRPPRDTRVGSVWIKHRWQPKPYASNVPFTAMSSINDSP